VVKYIFVVLLGVLLGIISIFFVRSHSALFENKTVVKQKTAEKKEVIGFLLYSLLSRAREDYSNEITTLSYFGLTVDTDGTIRKQNSPQENEPGWNALASGKVDSFLENAKKHKVDLSLVVFSGDNDDIDAIMEDPISHAENLTDEVLPIMDKYGFTNLNLDIEATKEASVEAQMHFLQFAKTINDKLKKDSGKTLTIDVTTLDLISNKNLINPKEAAKIADLIVIMAYDYHSSSSQVTGPVAPLNGAGIISEYDTQAALQKAILIIPRQKIILGVPLYGYEWDTLGDVPRSAIIPGSGNAASNRRVEKLANDCATCSAQFDTTAEEAYMIYIDPLTNTYHQIFYPTKESTLQKISLAQNTNIAGLALWSLGYEGPTIMNPLQNYLKSSTEGVE
jgi:spore germination protein YaaH